MNRTTIFGIIAAVMVTAGFGMIHGSYKNAEIYGALLIGLGSAYLLYLLYMSGRKKDKK